MHALGRLAVVMLVLAQGAEETISTPADFRKAMVAIDAAFGVVEPMVPSQAYLLNSARGDAIGQVAIMRKQMLAVAGFFTVKKEADAVVLARDTIAALEDFDKLLKKAEPDQAMAVEAVADINRTCSACHRVYREGDEQTGFRFKPGALK